MKLCFTAMKLEKQDAIATFPNGVWEREVSLVISFPTSRWERSIMKLCFTAMKLEKQDAVWFQTELGNREVNPRHLVPNVPLGTQHYEALLHGDEIRKARCRVRRSQTEFGNEK